MKAELAATKETVRAAQKVLDDANNEASENEMRVGEVTALYDEAKAAFEIVDGRVEGAVLSLTGGSPLSNRRKCGRGAAWMLAKAVLVALDRARMTGCIH